MNRCILDIISQKFSCNLINECISMHQSIILQVFVVSGDVNLYFFNWNDNIINDTKYSYRIDWYWLGMNNTSCSNMCDLMCEISFFCCRWVIADLDISNSSKNSDKRRGKNCCNYFQCPKNKQCYSSNILHNYKISKVLVTFLWLNISMKDRFVRWILQIFDRFNENIRDDIRARQP